MEEKRKPWSGLAVASVACGVLSLGLGFLTGIPAVICGHLGRARIRKAGGGLRGKGMALAGLTMGYFMTVFSLLGPGGLPTANAAIKRAKVIRFTCGGKPEVVRGRHVLVASKGPDGVEGTEDDVKSW